jgi:hypothetical protein
VVNRFNGVLKLHTASPDSKVGWVAFPWAILLSSFLINVLISVIVGGKVAIYTGGLSSIYIYMLIACIIGVNSTFPFALGLCIRRTDYFLGTSLVFLVLSLGNAVLLCLFSFIESDLTNNWWTQLHFFNLPFISEGGLIIQFFILFLAMLHLCFLGFGLSSIHRRFGILGVYGFSGILFLPITVIGFLASYFGWWDNIFGWIGEQGSLGVVLWLTPLTLLYAILSYWLLRKATI